MITDNGGDKPRGPSRDPRPRQNATPAKPGTGAHRPRGQKPLLHNQQESTRRHPTQHCTLLPGVAAREAYVTHPERHPRCPPETTFWSCLEEAGEQVSAHCCLCQPVVETERRRAEAGFAGLGVALGPSGGLRGLRGSWAWRFPLPDTGTVSPCADLSCSNFLILCTHGTILGVKTHTSLFLQNLSSVLPMLLPRGVGTVSLPLEWPQIWKSFKTIAKSHM